MLDGSGIQQPAGQAIKDREIVRAEGSHQPQLRLGSSFKPSSCDQNPILEEWKNDISKIFSDSLPHAALFLPPNQFELSQRRLAAS